MPPTGWLNSMLPETSWLGSPRPVQRREGAELRRGHSSSAAPDEPPGFVPLSDLGKDGAMPGRSYDRETRAKAVRLVRDHVDDYATEWAAIKAVSAGWG
jgi:hypothetical protein